jgi:hypothetical protein
MSNSTGSRRFDGQERQWPRITRDRDRARHWKSNRRAPARRAADAWSYASVGAGEISTIDFSPRLVTIGSYTFVFTTDGTRIECTARLTAGGGFVHGRAPAGCDALFSGSGRLHASGTIWPNRPPDARHRGDPEREAHRACPRRAHVRDPAPERPRLPTDLSQGLPHRANRHTVNAHRVQKKTCFEWMSVGSKCKPSLLE